MNIYKIKTVLFDLDGTLLDTAPDLSFALNKLLALEAKQAVSLAEVKQVASDGCKGLLALGLHIDESHPRYQAYKTLLLDFYQQHLCVNTTLFTGMAAVLSELEEQGITWGVVTNKSTNLTKQILTTLDLAERCICIVGGNCAPRCKPYPDQLLLACQEAGATPNECLYVGDAERDIIAAKQAGMRSIAALYGYVGKQCCPEQWQADYYIDHPKDILTWLEKANSGGVAV